MVDDIDRADPRLVPQFLLSLREVLDEPGFTFVLAFDPAHVVEILREYHPAWASGENFLEKILDFTFTLPGVTETQRKRLIQRGLKEYCPFVPEAELQKIYDLLPNNPRRLKSLVRALSVLKTEVQRHDPDELNWVEIGIAHLIKLESPQLLDRLIEGKEIEEELGLAYYFAEQIAERADQNGRRDDQLHKLAEELGSDDEQRARLKKLIDALRARGSPAGGRSFRYQAQLASRPHKITWKEFKEVLGIWNGSNDPKSVSEWVSKQADRRCASVDEVAEELFESLVNFRDASLSRASEVMTIEEHEAEMAHAHSSLELIESLFKSGLTAVPCEEFRTPGNFKLLLDMAYKWIHFDANPSDVEARENEKAVLLNFDSAATGGAHSFLEVLKPWDVFDAGGPFAVEARARLRTELVNSLAPQAAEEILELFDSPRGVAAVAERGRLDGLKSLLSG